MISFRRISHEMLGRAIANFNVRAAAVIQCQRAWIEHLMSYCAVLEKLLYVRKNLTPDKTYMYVKQAYKNCKVFISIHNAILPKKDSYFWTTLHLQENTLLYF